jgi:hypothetical protein
MMRDDCRKQKDNVENATCSLENYDSLGQDAFSIYITTSKRGNRDCTQKNETATPATGAFLGQSH